MSGFLPCRKHKSSWRPARFPRPLVMPVSRFIASYEYVVSIAFGSVVSVIWPALLNSLTVTSLSALVMVVSSSFASYS